MKRLLYTSAFFLSLLALTAGAQTVSYYVDAAKPTNGAGTQADPFNRIAYAVFPARDTTQDVVVYLKAGNYRIDRSHPADQYNQIYLDASKSSNTKHFTIRPYAGDEGKVVLDGSPLQPDPFYPSMMILSGARNVKLQDLVFRGLTNTVGYALNIQASTGVEVNRCVFDSLRWTATASEYGYATTNNFSHFIHAIYLSGNTNVTLANDTLRASALGWGEFVHQAGTNTALTVSGAVSANNTAIASQYYVSPTGNDTTGSGSFTNPFRTPQRAVAWAGYNLGANKPFNGAVTVHLRGGTYKPTGDGIFISTNRTTGGNWFTLRNYASENAVLDGSQLTAPFAALIAMATAKNIRIEGLKLTNVTNDQTVTSTRFGVIVSGQSANIVIRKNHIYDMAWTRNTAAQKTPQPTNNLNPLVVLGTTDTAIRNVVIDSNTVYNNVPGYAEAVSINGYVDSFAVTNNLVFDNANIGIVAAGNYAWVVDDPNFSVTAPNNYSRNGFIRGNTVYRNISPIAVSAGIYLDGSRNVLVENNLSYKNGTGISIGNEQYNSVSGYHTVQSNVLKENLSAGLFYGSTNTTSWVENCTVKDNTIKDNYVLDSALRARANNQYGITNSSQRYTEANIYRLRNSVFEQNTIESLSDIVLGFYQTQSNLTLRYNTYYVISENACNAIFVQDKNGDGSIGTPADSIYVSFHRYALRTGYDQTSECEGQDYSAAGCGAQGARMTGGELTEILLPERPEGINVYPNPTRGQLQLRLWAKEKETALLQVFDAAGRMVWNGRQALVEGLNQVQISDLKATGLKPGLHIITVQRAGGRETIKFTLQ